MKLRLLTFEFPEVIKTQLFPMIQYIIQQTGNEKTQTYQLDAVILIQYQILIANLQGNV